MYFIRLICTIFILSLFIIPKAHAIAAKHIMRNLGLLSRTVTAKKEEKPFKERSKYHYNQSFSLHNNFTCFTKTITDFDHQILSQWIINKHNMNKNPLLLSLVVETIKAHLYNAAMLYKTQGLNLDSHKLPAKFHTKSEIDAYQNEIAILSTEANTIHIPESIRSVVYIDYVIKPILKNFMTAIEKKYFQYLIGKLWFKDTLIFQKKRTLWHFKQYNSYITMLNKILNRIERRQLKKFNLSRQQRKYRQALLKQLIKHHWISYSAVNSCANVTASPDPAYDSNFFAQPSPTYDNYLMAYGLFNQINTLLRQDTDILKIDIIKKYVNFFQGLYLDPKAHHDYWSKLSKAKILHKYVLCTLGIEKDDKICIRNRNFQ